MRIELYVDGGVYLIMNIDTCLFLNFSSSTFLSFFMLIAFSFGKSKFIPDLNYQNLGVVFVEDDGSTNRFIFLYFDDDFARIYANA